MRALGLVRFAVVAAVSLPAVAQRLETPASEAAPQLSAVPCPEAAVARPIADPLAWARACLCDEEAGTAAEPCTLENLEKDLDLDGKNEWLVAAREQCGNAGCEYLAFASGKDGFRYLGLLFLHPKALRVLPADGKNPVRIMVYVRLGASEGLLRTIVHDGAAFRIVAEERIEPVGKDSRRYDALFAPPGGP